MSSQVLFRIGLGAAMTIIALVAGRQLKEPALNRAVSRAPADWQRTTIRRLGSAATIFLCALMFFVEAVSHDMPVQLAVIIALPGVVVIAYRRGIRDGRKHPTDDSQPEA